MNVSVIGTGYVGLVMGVALARAGHRVVCVGRNKEKVDAINRGKAPFFEPGLDALLERVLNQKRLTASADLPGSVVESNVTIIAVGTPTVDGAIDLGQIREAAREVGEALKKKRTYHVVAVKSTVTPGTTQEVVWPILTRVSGKSGKEIGLCMNPEFLREGNALEDALTPDRIVIGSLDKKAGATYAKLFTKDDCPVFFVNLATAEMSKYVENVLLATLVSFSNEIGNLAASIPGVDVVDVWKTVHADRRLSPGVAHYLFTGCGYGGSCFPKDTKALFHFAREKGISMAMLGSTIAINQAQPHGLVELVARALGGLQGKRIAVLGLTFKPDTDDVRESPSAVIIDELLARGARVVCHDPKALGTHVREYSQALDGADAALILTAWDEYKKITPNEFVSRMRTPIVIDGRRIYDPFVCTKAGVRYLAVGRASDTV